MTEAFTDFSPRPKPEITDGNGHTVVQTIVVEALAP
jgi:hypothetical protein